MTSPDPEPGGAVSPQWRQWRESIDLDEYERRFLHDQAHGEADLIEALAREQQPARSVLDAGCGTGRVAIELDRRGLDVVGADLDGDLLALAEAKAPHMRWLQVDLATMQLDRRFGIVAMPGNVMLFCRDSDRLAVVHSCVQLLEPGGLLIAGFSCDRSLSVAQYDELCAACDLTLVHRWATWERAPFRDGDYVVSVHSRDSRFNVHDALAAARSTIHRLSPAELTERLAGEHPPTVVDTRTDTDRRRSGSIPGSIHMPSTVLQWRLDPASGYRHPAAIPLDQPVVVVCNHGYSSSMAAAALTSIGFENVSDLVGGMAAWIAAGGPVHPADGSPARG